MSIAGGYYKAVEAAARCGMECVQVFTKNASQWRAKEIAADEVEAFAGALREGRIEHPIAHASYLINLASPNAALWEKSIEGMLVELTRAELLGIGYVVVHPGACVEACEDDGIANVVRAIDEIHRRLPRGRTQILLETTAGQGTCLGCRFEQLAAMLTGVQQPERLGVCVDTCHIFAAGYPITERKDYLQTIRKLDDAIGLDRVKAFHLNDSKRELGSKVDRHAHIGQGQIGLEAFRHVLTDRRFRRVPMYLETNKGTTDDGEDWDAVNLRTLRSLLK
jgi:deoxyribonuclease-4